MTIEYSDVFLKSTKKLTDKIAVKRLKELIVKLENAVSLNEIPNVVTVKGNVGIYRIRTGDYRLIVEYWNGDITILLLEYLKRDDNTYRKYN